MIKNFFAVSSLTVLLTAAAVSSVNLTVDPASTHQTMDGLGIYNDIAPWKIKDGIFWVDVDLDALNYYDMLIADLGVTITRVWVEYDIEPTNDNGDANNLDLSAYSVGGNFGARLPYWQKLQSAANKYGVDLKTFASVLSPPAWMKANGVENCPDGSGNCYLLPEMYYEFSEFVAAYLKLYEREVGVEVYGVSLQNELMFPEPYASTVYSPAQFRDILKITGPRLVAEGIGTKILGAEHMLWGFPQYESTALADPVAAQYLHTFILHSYLTDVNPIPADDAVQDWVTAANYARQNGRGLWMSETSGYAANWTGAMELAAYIYVALKHGNITGWVFYNQSELLPNGMQTGKYAISKNYFHFIRPGAVMVDIDDSGDNALRAIAFKHEANGTFTIVICNSGTSKDIDLIGTGLPSEFAVYQSTDGQVCENTGTVQSSGTITLAGNSVTTLFSGVDLLAQPVAAKRAEKMLAVGSGNIRTGSIYTINGKFVKQLGSVEIDDLLNGKWYNKNIARGSYIGVVKTAAGAVRIKRVVQ